MSIASMVKEMDLLIPEPVSRDLVSNLDDAIEEWNQYGANRYYWITERREAEGFVRRGIPSLRPVDVEELYRISHRKKDHGDYKEVIIKLDHMLSLHIYYLKHPVFGYFIVNKVVDNKHGATIFYAIMYAKSPKDNFRHIVRNDWVHEWHIPLSIRRGSIYQAVTRALEHFHQYDDDYDDDYEEYDDTDDILTWSDDD